MGKLNNIKQRKRVVSIGDKFGKLTVTGLYTKNSHIYCKCMCECGKECDIRKDHIYGRTSCGCDYVPKVSKLENQRFGRWTVKEYNRKLHKWFCVCDCGNTGFVSTGDLNSYHSQSCGCWADDLLSMRNRKNIIGRRVGHLVVLDRVIKENGRVGKYKCLCDCGDITYVDSTNLMQEHTLSCGCLQINADGSKAENEIKDFVEELSNKKFTKVKILDRKEIDMYNDELKLGIEYNGSYFHASINGVYGNKDKNYYRDKFLLAKEKGIHLINIFDVDWSNNKERIQNYIKSLICQSIDLEDAYILKCISKNEAKVFMNRYCISGFYNRSSINCGLYVNDELIAVLSCGRLRLAKSEAQKYELYNFAVKCGYKYNECISKLFSYFIETYKPLYVVAYSDNDYYNWNIYELLNFVNICQKEQDFYWLKGSTVFSKEQCKLSYLQNKYEDLYKKAKDIGVVDKAVYILSELGAQKVYRSGNTKWEWKSNR